MFFSDRSQIFRSEKLEHSSFGRVMAVLAFAHPTLQY